MAGTDDNDVVIGHRADGSYQPDGLSNVTALYELPNALCPCGRSEASVLLLNVGSLGPMTDLPSVVPKPVGIQRIYPMGKGRFVVELWELICREQIRDVVGRYAAYVDSGRMEEIMTLFAPEAVFLLDDKEFHGHDEIKSIFTNAGKTLVEHAGPRPLIRHMITTHEIVPISENSARSRAYFLAMVGDRITHWGRYADEFAPSDGDWKIVQRKVIVDVTIKEGWTG